EHYRDSFDSPKTEILEKIRAQLSSFAAGHLPAELKFESDVFVGRPYDELERASNSFSADLVILGSHGLTVGSHRVGNIATRSVRKLPRPVLLVRESHVGEFKTVVAAIDLSDTSAPVLQQAATIAAGDKSKLHILHVHCPPWLWLSSSVYGINSVPNPEYETEYRRTLDDQLASAILPIREEFPDLEIIDTIVEDESTAPVIRDYLIENNADLAVIGSHGSGGLKAMFLGTTAERMICDSPCSVLTVKAK
ncbi:MAG: nucleotide-binding universal stress UspA family protein, partial [Verrucomicrobiales bacterium]